MYALAVKNEHFRNAIAMSALPPKAGIRESDWLCQSRALYPASEKTWAAGADVEIFRTQDHGTPG
jgi:hypothetical protein